MILPCDPEAVGSRSDTTNEASEDEFFRSDVPKIPQGLSPLSSASLYLKTQTSTPCAMLANSLDSTFDWRYSRISGGKVTVRDNFFLLGMQVTFLWKCFNTSINDSISASNILAGTSQDGKYLPISGRFGQISDHKVTNGCNTMRSAEAREMVCDPGKTAGSRSDSTKGSLPQGHDVITKRAINNYPAYRGGLVAFSSAIRVCLTMHQPGHLSGDAGFCRPVHLSTGIRIHFQPSRGVLV